MCFLHRNPPEVSELILIHVFNKDKSIMQAKKTKKLVSIITASNRPHHMRSFFKNLLETVNDYAAIEVLVKIDEGDHVMRMVLDEAVAQFPYEIRFIQTPRIDGYYTLHYGYQQLFEMSDPDTYFIFPVNEEVRFKTKGWDDVLAKYQHFYADDCFRLKISRLKFRNYYSYHDCGPAPENYPFMTRKWFELAGGIGDCWGPDGWHQYIDYHLGLTEGINGIPGIFRSVPILDILIDGEEAGKELSAEQTLIRSHRIFQEWWRMYRSECQIGFRRIATKMFAYIWAKNENIDHFEIIENTKAKFFSVRDVSSSQIKNNFFYYVSPLSIRFMNYFFLIKMARRNSAGFLRAYIYPSYGPRKGLKGWLNFFARYFIVLTAVILSFFVSAQDSVPKGWLYKFRQRMSKIGGYVFGNDEPRPERAPTRNLVIRNLKQLGIHAFRSFHVYGGYIKKVGLRSLSLIYYTDPLKKINKKKVDVINLNDSNKQVIKPKNHLISGASSGLGRYLKEKLDGVSFNRSQNTLKNDAKKVKPFETIIHCAFNAKSKIDSDHLKEYLNDNLMLTQRLLAIPHQKFIFISSADVYPKQSTVWREDSPFLVDEVDNMYGISKLLAESLVQNSTPNYLILRLTALLGKYARPNSLVKMLASENPKLTLQADSSFNYILHEDVYRFIQLAIEKDLTGIYNLAANGNVTLHEVAAHYNKQVEFGDFHYQTPHLSNEKATHVCNVFSSSSLENIERFKAIARFN